MCKSGAGRRKAELVVDCAAAESAGLLVMGRRRNGLQVSAKKRISDPLL